MSTTQAALPEPPWPSIARIQARVAVARRIPMIEIISARRHRDVVIARHMAMYLAKRLTPRSLPQIGRQFGGRDHTTVIHAIRKTEERIAAEPELSAQVERLARELGVSVEAGGLLAVEAVEAPSRQGLVMAGELGHVGGELLADAAEGAGGDGGVDRALGDLVAVEVLDQPQGEMAGGGAFSNLSSGLGEALIVVHLGSPADGGGA